ncbi:AAA family ATPase [Nocardia otitidiscaviarum]|uniref:AAA family ATPase n=1 Tax=Nocardia otitidiscaviarum TaxID=1823 RepID=A0A516NGT4_9NOCA|nr:LuxR family transcriptional regulator [Nocardia otitidiscaviarum]MCP9625359.1 LuxR C-terminal-related transcriptional regulator [Nocardia otitidiscaviarum]QDP78110.1 AAA family ATPase [Nocardia otitidiscaviarum]
MLYGRQVELSVLSETLHGEGGALIVRGEAGIGKSALLETAAARVRARVLRVAGAESEADLPFSALHLLLRPILDRVDALPRQQAHALRAAFGLEDAVSGDRFLVGLATLELLVELSASSPVVCLIDDAQWLDGESADALLFAARRLHAEPVTMLFAARADGFPASGLPELRVGRLDEEAARALLAERAADLPPAVRAQVLAETEGNPLALIEIPRMLTPAQRRGASVPMSFSLGTATAVTDRVLLGFRDRIARLPPATRCCLLVATLGNHDELRLLERAVGLLGATLADFAAAEHAGLVRVGPDGVAFHHPLVRTAVLLACDVAAGMAAHRALAEASDDDRRAWHLAAVTLQPDEDVAERLEGLALRARRRGGQAAVSAAYARAAELSADVGHAVRRGTAAAAAAIEAGMWQRAAELVEKARQRADAIPPRGAVRAELAYVQAKLEVEAGRPLHAVRLLHQAVAAADDLTTRLSLLSMAGYYTWASAAHPDQLTLARRTEELSPDGDGLSAVVRTINLAFRLILEGDDVTTLTYPVAGLDETVPNELRFLITFQSLARADFGAMLEGATELVEECRAEGRLGRMPQAMLLLTLAQLLDGRHRSARATAAAGLALAADVGQPMWRGYLAGANAWLSAVAGDEAECEALAEQAIRDADPTQWMPAACWVESARGMLDLGSGRFESMLDRVDRAMSGPTRHAFLWRYSWPDYVEAAVRVGDPARSHDRLARYAEWARSAGRAGPLAVLHRVRALLAPDDAAGALYERALVLHARERQPFDEARTRLVYGEWLRRDRRRAEARTHLRIALETFDRLGAAPWSARASAELRATGVTVPGAGIGDPLGALTPQEQQVVRLAVTGASNREIGAQLFLSPRTVASHLYKAFPKLGVSSRAELSRFPELN